MRSIKTQGIVIKRMELGEADRLLTIFTCELGKVRALARGVRKPLSKLAGHLEPGSVTDCQLHEGRSFYLVTGAEMSGSFTGIRDKLAKTSLACYLLEMVDALTHDGEVQPSIFHLLRDSLTLLESPDYETNGQLLTSAFRLQLLADLGYLPETARCVHCQQVLLPEGNVFSLHLGGILGADCARQDFETLPISTDAIKAMRLLLDQPLAIIYRLKVNKKVLAELDVITENYLHYHVGRPLYSASFLKEATL